MVNWNSDTDLRLLINCIDPATKPNWERVAIDMGPGFTTESVRQRFAKIKKSALATSTAVAATVGASGSPVTPATPAKRSRGKKDNIDGTPSKKARGKKADPETPIKNGTSKVENTEVEVKREAVKLEDTA